MPLAGCRALHGPAHTALGQRGSLEASHPLQLLLRGRPRPVVAERARESEAGKVSRHAPPDAIEIDLALKDLQATSDGIKVEPPPLYRDLKGKLATAQRAGKKARERAIHAKIKNRRSDHLHKLSRALASSHGAIFVDNVSAAALAQTALAKSVLDAGWSVFRTQLRSQCHQARALFLEVNAAGSTQTCSACHAGCGPRAIAGLGTRAWASTGCAALHDRDVSSARLILAAGRRRLVEGILALPAQAAA